VNDYVQKMYECCFCLITFLAYFPFVRKDSKDTRFDFPEHHAVRVHLSTFEPVTDFYETWYEGHAIGGHPN
jgi:hypothetical protein